LSWFVYFRGSLCQDSGVSTQSACHPANAAREAEEQRLQEAAANDPAEAERQKLIVESDLRRKAEAEET